jgi:hypothetical protein
MRAFVCVLIELEARVSGGGFRSQMSAALASKSLSGRFSFWHYRPPSTLPAAEMFKIYNRVRATLAGIFWLCVKLCDKRVRF